MFRLTEFYLRVCAEHDVRIPDGFGEHRDDVGAIERSLAARPLPTLPCHNDLLAENYIDDGVDLWIVDFEYSGNNDPTFNWVTRHRSVGSTRICVPLSVRRTSANPLRLSSHGWSYRR